MSDEGKNVIPKGTLHIFDFPTFNHYPGFFPMFLTFSEGHFNFIYCINETTLPAKATFSQGNPFNCMLYLIKCKCGNSRRKYIVNNNFGLDYSISMRFERLFHFRCEFDIRPFFHESHASCETCLVNYGF